MAVVSGLTSLADSLLRHLLAKHGLDDNERAEIQRRLFIVRQQMARLGTLIKTRSLDTRDQDELDNH
jgi:hypothetical protein